MSLSLIAIAAGVLGAWVTLRLLGNERERRRNHIEYQHQVRLYQALIHLKSRGQL